MGKWALPIYREEKGVKVRVECGPSDINRHTCVLAVNKKAGELAEKQTLKVPSLHGRFAILHP